VDSLKARLADLERVTALLARMSASQNVSAQQASQRQLDRGELSVTGQVVVRGRDPDG
jgi:hypothetical protein